MKKFLNIKSLYLILLLISFSILIYFCVDDNNLFTLIDNISLLNMPWLIVACVFMLLSWFIDAFIIKILTNSVCEQKYILKDAFKVTMVGQFFNAVTPFCLASQPMQILTMSQQKIDAGHSLSIVVRKFIIYQTTLVFYLVTTMIFSYSFFADKIPEFMNLAILGCVSQTAVVLLIAFFTVKKDLTLKLISWFLDVLAKFNLISDLEEKKKSAEKQMNIYAENNKAIKENPKLTLKVFFLTYLQFTFLFSISFCIYKAFNNPYFDIIDMISGQAFVTTTAAYTPLPGGSGAMEGSFLMVFRLFFSSASIKPAMLLWRFITYYSCIIFGVFFAMNIKKTHVRKTAFLLKNKT